MVPQQEWFEENDAGKLKKKIPKIPLDAVKRVGDIFFPYSHIFAPFIHICYYSSQHNFWTITH